MKKEEFFEELKNRLSVIENDELEDILNEYRQHIEIKTKEENISEEDVIRDFGSIDELSSEILESYHIRSDFNSARENKFPKKKISNFFSFALSKIKKFFNSIGAYISRLWKNLCSFFRGVFSVPKESREEKDIAKQAKRLKRQEARNNKKQSKESKTPVNYFLNMARQSICFVGRLCWNIFFGIIAFLIFAIFCISVIGFGMASALATSFSCGMLGITILLLGLSLVSISMLIFVISFFKHKKKQDAPKTNQAENVIDAKVEPKEEIDNE